MRYYGNVMTTTRWRLYVILHLQQYSRRLNLFFYHGATVPVGQGLLIIEDSRSHSVGLLWTSDKPDA